MPLSRLEAIEKASHEYEKKYPGFLNPNYQPSPEEAEEHKNYLALKRTLDRMYPYAAFRQFLDKENEDLAVTDRILAPASLGPVPENLQVHAASSSTKVIKAKEQKPKNARLFPKGRRARKWHESSPDVLRRHQIVLKNPKMSAKSICKLFDGIAPPIPLPRDWSAELDVKNWTEAYGNKKARNRIQKMISTYRHSK